jgi:hypothetical protein
MKTLKELTKIALDADNEFWNGFRDTKEEETAAWQAKTNAKKELIEAICRETGTDILTLQSLLQG